MTKLKKGIVVELRGLGIILNSDTPSNIIEKYAKDFPELKDSKLLETTKDKKDGK